MVELVPRSGDTLREGELPVEMWPHAGAAFEERCENGVITSWKVGSTSGKTRVIPANQIVHIKLPNPYRPKRGLAPIDAAMMGVNQDWKAGVFNQAFFDNGAQPGGVITLDAEQSMNAEQRRQFLAQFEERHRGARKHGRPAVLQGGMKWEQTGETHLDMQFLEQRKWNRQEILAVFGVPPTEVGIFEDAGGLSGEQTKRGAARSFWQDTLIPHMNRIRDAFNAKLLSRVEAGKFFCWWSTDGIEALRDDFSEKVTTAKNLADMGYPINQVNKRLDLGMDPVAWGDMAYGSISDVPMDVLLENGGGLDEPDPAADEDEEDPEKPPPDKDKAVRRGVTREQSEARKKLWLESIEKVFTPGERRLMGRLRRHFLNQRADVLRRLREVESGRASARGATQKDLTPNEIERILFDGDEWNQKLKKTVLPADRATASAALDELSREVGGLSFNTRDPALERFLDRKTFKVAEQVNRTVREALRRQLQEGLAGNETVQQISERIRGVYGLAGSPARRLRIARTETSQVVNNVRALAMKAEEIEEHEWLSAGDEEVRHSHDIDGEKRRIGEAFSNGLRWPGDTEGPADEVVNCRCKALAIVPKPKEDE